jgi:tetratricopeptide (TPR) repeat protein
VAELSEARRRHPGLPALLLAALLTAGCATSTPPPGQTPSPAEPAGTPAPEHAPATAAPSSDAATLALLEQSERAAKNGALDEALSYAERAVRIEPRRADLWTHLAALELTDGNPTTAIQYANKALALAADRPDWQRDAWLVIADAKDALGETEEAQAIRRRWQTARG